MAEDENKKEGKAAEGPKAGEGATKGGGKEGKEKPSGAEKPPAKKPAPKKPAPKKPAGTGGGESEPSETLIISSSPHFLGDESVPKIMHTVVLSLLPAVGAAVYFFGIRALLLVLVCVATCLGVEYAIQKLRNKPIKIHDGSAIITGVLLALTLPPEFPVYAAVLGSAFAIGVGKQLFGGLGFNIFNPALLGRAFLQATYPVLITTWVEPRTVERAADAVSAATPLALMKFEGTLVPITDLLVGNVAGSLGETSAIALIVGGLYLRYKGYINWKLPLGYLGSMAVFSGIFWLYDPSVYAPPWHHVLAGGAMIAAWFMVTDMVTTPVTAKGQWIFAIAAGIMAVVIRLFGGLPEGVMYSVLFMNAFVPLINRHTKPKVFGEGYGAG